MPKNYIEVWVMPTYTADIILPLYNDFSSRLSRLLGHKVQIKIIPWNKVLKQLFTAFKNDSPPDVIQIGNSWLNTFAHMGYLAPVPDSFKMPKALAPWITQSCQYKDSTIAVPWFVESSMLMARRDILKEQGISSQDIESLEGFKNVCEKLYTIYGQSTTKPILPFVASLRPEPGRLHYLIPFLWASGWDFKGFNSAEDIFDKGKLSGSFNYLRDLYKVSRVSRELLSTNPYIINQQFYWDGSYVFTTGHWWRVILELVDGYGDPSKKLVPLEALPMPSGSFGPTPWGGGSMLCVAAASPYQKEAWTIIEHMQSSEFINERIHLCGELPAFETDFWQQYKDNPQIKIIRTQIEKSRTYPKHPLWITFEQLLAEGFSSLLWHYIYDEEPLETLYPSIIDTMSNKISELHGLAWESDIYD